MKVMHNEQRMLVTVLKSFVHDPLLEWTTTESRNQQARQVYKLNKKLLLYFKNIILKNNYKICVFFVLFEDINYY